MTRNPVAPAFIARRSDLARSDGQVDAPDGAHVAEALVQPDRRTAAPSGLVFGVSVVRRPRPGRGTAFVDPPWGDTGRCYRAV